MNVTQKVIEVYRREGLHAVPRLLRKFGFMPPPALVDKLWMDWSWVLPGGANRCNMRVFALRRSGHHAVLNWVRYHLRGRYCFLNDCKVGENPFLSCSRDKSIVRHLLGEHAYINWKREERGHHAKKGTIIHNYEDSDFRAYAATVTPEDEVAWLGPSERSVSVLILRDPFNLFSSKLRWAYGGTLAPSLEDFGPLVELWKVYAREFLRITDILSDKVCISYNGWFGDRSYRNAIARNLLFRNRDRGMDEVAKWGPTTWGDSFDGLRYDGRARQMKVLSRWKKYQDDPFYRGLFRDHEIFDLSAQIFGEIEGTEVLRS